MQPDYEKLIDYLDKQLNQEETARVETILQEDIDFKKEFTYLRFAVDTVRLDVLNQKVASVRNAQKEQIEARPTTSILRSMYPVSLRAAAVIVILLSVAT